MLGFSIRCGIFLFFHRFNGVEEECTYILPIDDVEISLNISEQLAGNVKNSLNITEQLACILQDILAGMSVVRHTDCRNPAQQLKNRVTHMSNK